MKKLLITGASGYLANTLVPYAFDRANVIGVARDASQIHDGVKAVSLDITNRSAVHDVLLDEKPDAVIHCAACNPGTDDENMSVINESGSRHIAEAAGYLGCRLVAVSSDTVFNGRDAPFDDYSPVSPLTKNAYALSKARAESAIFSLVPDALVVRTSLIYGFGKIDRGTQSFAKRLKKNESLNLFTDVIRQPVYDQSLSECLTALALDYVNETGTMNIAGDQALSRYDFGLRMLDHWGIDYTDRLKPVSGACIAGLPMDLRLSLRRARALRLPTPGVSTVIRQFAK